MDTNATQRERVPRLLRDFATALAAAGPDEENLVRAAVTSCKDLLRAKQCSVWLADSTPCKLVLRAATGYTNLGEEAIGRLSYNLAGPPDAPHGVTAWIFQQQRPVSANSYSELKSQPGHRGAYDEQLHGLDIKKQISDARHPCQQFYGGPITLGEIRFGVLKVENKMPTDDGHNSTFSETDKAALDTVAAMLALALQYAREAQHARSQLQKYHAFTVHSIRNELMPIETARDRLHFLVSGGRSITKEDLDVIQRFQKLGTQGLDFYLKHLLKFLRAEIDRESLEQVNLFGILEIEVWLLGEVSDELLNVNLPPISEADKRLSLIHGDKEFLAAMFKELLRNARRAIYRRRQRDEANSRPTVRGRVDVTMTVPRPGNGNGPREITISVADNGDATADDFAAAKLRRAWDGLRGTVASDSSQRGLAFVNWIVGEHRGRLSLDCTDKATVFNVTFPAS